MVGKRDKIAMEASGFSSPPFHKNKHGDTWPQKGDTCEKVSYGFTVLDKAIGLSTAKDTAVQAGGNCGIFPRHMALFYKNVYTFEPFQSNFECLQLNCIDKNVFAFNYALGAEAGKTRVKKWKKNNCGDVRTGDEGEEVQVITIDSLNLTACDLIFLDTQGDELSIIEGAEETIEKFWPVLGLEWAGKVWKDYKKGGKKGSPGLFALEKKVTEWGYKAEYKSKDRIYVRRTG